MTLANAFVATGAGGALEEEGEEDDVDDAVDEERLLESAVEFGEIGLVGTGAAPRNAGSEIEVLSRCELVKAESISVMIAYCLVVPGEDC